MILELIANHDINTLRIPNETGINFGVFTCAPASPSMVSILLNAEYLTVEGKCTLMAVFDDGTELLCDSTPSMKYPYFFTMTLPQGKTIEKFVLTRE